MTDIFVDAQLTGVPPRVRSVRSLPGEKHALHALPCAAVELRSYLPDAATLFDHTAIDAVTEHESTDSSG